MILIELLLCSLAQARAVDVAPAAGGVLEDLAFLEELLLERHPRPFWLRPREGFDALVGEVRERLSAGGLEREQVVTELLRVIAYLGDAHTHMASSSRYDELGYLPLSFEWSAAGELRVVKATVGQRALLGCRVLAIDGVPTRDVREKIAPIVPHATQGGFRHFSPRYLHLPGALHGVGISKRPDSITLRVDNDSGPVEVIVEAMTPEQEERAEFLHLEPIERDDLPVSLIESDRNYRFELLPGSRTLYLAFDRASHDEEESFWAFCERMFDVVDEQAVERVIVDLRRNGGGNYVLGMPLVHGLRKRPRIDRPGGLFVLIGPHTFSAAIVIANQLELQTHAVLVGEEAADRANSPGDNETSRLPISGVAVRVSALYHETSYHCDRRPARLPDVRAELSIENRLAGEDPVLDLVLAWEAVAGQRTVKDAARYTGRFRFSPGNALRVFTEADGLRATVAGCLTTPLVPLGAGSFATEIDGLTLHFDDRGELSLRQADGNERELPRLDDAQATAAELLLSGDFEAAETEYRALLAAAPDDPALQENNLALMAANLFFRTRDRETTRALLEIAVRLHPDGTFASECLQYY